MVPARLGRGPTSAAAFGHGATSQGYRATSWWDPKATLPTASAAAFEARAPAGRRPQIEADSRRITDGCPCLASG
jgi:hypothetical protein